MKKLFALLLLCALGAALSSCADAAVTYRLSQDNSVKIDYSITLTPGEESVSSYFSSIEKYWIEMGFNTGSSKENGKYTITGEKTIDCDTSSAAAAQLSTILMDENSIFQNADFNYTPAYFEDNYSFTADVSLKDIIRKNEEHTIPAGEVEALISSAGQGEYILRISLPGEVVKTNADSQEGGLCEWKLKYGETRSIELSTKRVFDENIAHYDKLKDTESKDSLLLLICAAGAGAALLTIIILLIVRRSRSRRAQY